MVNSRFARVYDALVRHRRPVLAVLSALVGLGLLAATQLHVDVSFQPFFAKDRAAAERTEQFEARFGQRSGEYLVAIVGHDDVLAPSFLRSLRGITDEVARIPHVAEATSLSTARTLRLAADGSPQVVPLVAPEALTGSHQELAPAARAALLARPDVRGQLVARDGKSAVVLARVELPLSDLKGRSPVIDRFEHAVEAGAPAGSSVRVTGVSVVEREYGALVLRNLVTSVLLASTVMLLVLWARYRRVAAVVTVMSGVWAALPVTLGAFWLLDLDLTAINSTVLTIVLVIGVTQGIHLQEEFYRQREHGHSGDAAAQRMFARLAVPVAATSLTTLLGFLSLRTASISAIRDFAVASSIGIVIVYCTQNLLVPVLLRRLQAGPSHARMAGRARVTTAILRLVERVTTRRPAAVVAVGLVAFLGFAAWGLPRLTVDQRFNQEVAPSQPVRANQALLEEQYSGFLGPELWVRPVGGVAVTSARTLEELRAFTERLRGLPEVLHVEAATDLLPPGVAGPDAEAFLARLRQDEGSRQRVDGLISPDATDAGVLVRTTDMGTARAGSFASDVQALAKASFHDDARVDVVGQWWLAQIGMRHLLADTLTSVTTALVTILPVMFVVLRRWRLIAMSILPAVVPVVGALAVMGTFGIPLRVGTAMILAIALGLVDDDTIHFLYQLREAERSGVAPQQAVRGLLRRTAQAGLFSSLVLVAGFAAMAVSDFYAIRDMAIVAAATMLIAVTADLVFDPAQFLLFNRIGRPGPRGAASRTDTLPATAAATEPARVPA